jgi:hypothetical protein
MNAPCSGAPLTAPHVTIGGLCRWKALNKVGRHVGLDFYDLLIEGDYTHNPKVLRENGDAWTAMAAATKYLRAVGGIIRITRIPTTCQTPDGWAWLQVRVRSYSLFT